MNRVNGTFSRVKGPLVLHSGGAKMQPFLNIYQGLANVAAFVVNSDDDLCKVREKLPQQVIIGNIEGPDLNKLSAEAVSRKTAEICEHFGNDPHFIFGSSGADRDISKQEAEK